MGDLGDLLREARENKGLSLEQAEADTRIRYKFLAALENEEYASLPGAVYVKGFLKTYAIYLGLDPKHVVGLYSAVAGHQETQKSPAVPLVAVPMQEARPLRPFVIGLAVVAVLLLLAAAYVRLPWRDWLGLTTPTVQPSPTPTATVAPTSTPKPLPPTATPTAEPVLTPAPSGEIRVQFVVTGRSWVQIVVDGEVAYSGLLEDETREWAGSQKILARLGNAGAVDVTVNGEHVGFLGGAGEVVVQEWAAQPPAP